MNKKISYTKKVFSISCSLLLIIGLITINPVKAKTNSYLPKTPEAEKVIVLDLSHDLKNKDGEAKEAYMAITSIQGIINRESKTKIYLTHTPQEHDWTPFAADEAQLNSGLIPAEKVYPSLNYGKKYPVLSYLLEQYHTHIAGMIQVPLLSGKIVDGAFMAGVTAAGIENSILASDNIEKYIQKEGYSFEIKANTRNFKNNIDSFEWAYENYFEKCNKVFAAQHTFTAFGGGMDDQFPIMYDYYISSQVFVFCLDGNKEDELAKLQSFLVPENYAPGTAVLGLPVDEGKGIACISDSGYYFAIMYVPNLTVTSSFEYDQSTIQEPIEPTALKTDNNTNYVAFFATDGDSMGFPTNFMYKHISNSSHRGDVPIGWSFNPHLIDLYPTLLSYYSKNNYNSFYEYVASMNNGGSPKNEIGAQTFKQRYIDYVNKSNGMFRTINYFNDDAYIDDLTNAVNPYLLIKGYQGQTDGNDTVWGEIGDNKVTFTTMSGATQGNAHTKNIVEALKKISTTKESDKPSFTVVCVGDGRWSEDPTQHVNEAIEQLKQTNPDQNYTFMRPSDLAATYKAYQGDTSVTVGNPKVVTLKNNNEIDKISVDKSSIELVERKEESIKGYALDSQDQLIPGKLIEYKSQNPDIATVNEKGTVKGLKNGNTIITVSCEDKSTTVAVKVIGRQPSSIAVDKESLSTAVGGEIPVKAQLYDQYGEAILDTHFTWNSDNENVATVDNGVIKGVKSGSATITISYENINTQIQVTVLESTESISRVVINPGYLELYEGDIYSVSVNAYDKNNNEVFGFTPKWNILNQETASIDEHGYIHGLKAGQTKVSATFGENVVETIDIIVKADDRKKITFENTKVNEYVENVDDIVSFEAGSFKGYGKQGAIEGNAIKLDDERYEKAFTFKEKTVLKSIKAYNPTDKIVNITLVGSPDNEMIYRIEPGKSITLKTNWQSEKTFHVIKTTDTNIAFGEFVYGNADPIPTSLEIDQGSDQLSIIKDNSLNLSATLYDQNHNKINYDQIEWSTDRDDIVSVDKDGKITGIAEGSTFIYAKTKGLVASVLVYVTVTDIDRIDISPNSLTYYVGDIIPLTAKAYDKNNKELNFPLTWEITDNSIVSINEKNYLKALKEGTTQITAIISGIKKTIPVYVKNHPTSDHVLTFTEFEAGKAVNGLVNDRVTFEENFWIVKKDIPEMSGNAIHLPDENTGEKAFVFNTATTVKSFKVHNPTNVPRKVAIKTLDNSLPKVEYNIPAGETYTIYTQYSDQATGYAFETFFEVVIGEIVYTDTLETGFTSTDIAEGLLTIENPSIGQTQLTLPKVDGFDITILESDHPDIVNIDGTIDPLGINKDVNITLQVIKKTETRNKTDIAKTKPITVKVLGIPSDKSKLQEVIQEADSIILESYTPSTVDLFKKSLAKAKDALINQALRQREVNDIKANLETTMKNLLKKSNKEKLQTLLDDINKMNASIYTPNSYQNLQKLVIEANKILHDDEIKQSHVDDIVNQLNEAIHKLTKRADKTELEKLYKDYSDKDLTDYTDESIIPYNNALKEAKAILDDQNANQDDVNNIIKKLNEVVNTLIKKVDKTELEKLYKDYSVKDLTDYTDESIILYKNTLKDTKLILDNQNATQTEVNNAIKALKLAEEKLVKKVNIEPENNNSNNPSQNQISSNQEVNTGDYNPLYSLLALISLSILGILYTKKNQRL